MSNNRLTGPIILLGASVVLLLVLLFGFSNVSKESKKTSAKRSQTVDLVSPGTLLRDAKMELSSEALEVVETFEIQLEKTTEEEKRIELMEELASRWYRLSKPALSGYYAENIAALKSSDPMAWSIAGTTYTLCIQSDDDPKTKQFCAKRARAAFENAISLEPEEPAHRVNLAVAIVEYPDQDNPMQGILMLRELADQYPENPTVLFNLGRFAIQTGQYDKAIERLSAAMEIDPNSKAIACLLGQAYQGSGNEELAELFLKECN